MTITVTCAGVETVTKTATGPHHVISIAEDEIEKGAESCIINEDGVEYTLPAYKKRNGWSS